MVRSIILSQTLAGALTDTLSRGGRAISAIRTRLLNYCFYNENGAQGRNRTTDTVIFSHVLYQLSYLGTGDGQVARSSERLP